VSFPVVLPKIAFSLKSLVADLTDKYLQSQKTFYLLSDLLVKISANYDRSKIALTLLHNFNFRTTSYNMNSFESE